ncbi:MAG: hypothetical protein JWN71_4826 [Xanthobacteraceae bacterium]|nr:hypothetical protein [Xanthobacteraceae bacterium]
MFRAAMVCGFAILMAVTGSAVLAQTGAPPNVVPGPQAGGTKSLWPQPGAPQSLPEILPQAAGKRATPQPGAQRIFVTPPAAPGGYSEQPFSESELLAGKRMTEAECTAQPSAVWVMVGKTGECIAYYHAVPAAVATSAVGGAPTASAATANAAAGSATSASATGGDAPSSVIVFISSDVVLVNGRGEVKPFSFYAKTTPNRTQVESANWSRGLRLPYLMIARPGTYGSSGNHVERRSEREIAVVSAALDAIKARHNYQRLHLAGYAEGAHTAAMLMTRRDDLGCVVLASGLLSIKQYLAEQGRTADWTGNKNPLDPAGTRDRIVRQSALRVLVMTDPDDLVISARSQTAYVRHLDGLPIRQIFSAAPDPGAHGLLNQARQMTADCAKGLSDDSIRQKYENKVPAEPPDADDPPLHRPDTLRRELSISEAQCGALKTALWLTVDGRKLCIRYWMSAAGSTRTEPLVFFDGDLGSNDNGRLALNPAAERVSAGQIQRIAHLWSRNYGGPYVELARVGTLGSSGSHTKDRRTLFEVRVAMAALDALKAKFGWTRLHVVGQSGGGHTVAGLARQRDDIGCAVMASGAIAVKLSHLYRGAVVGDIIRSKYDPYDQILDKPYPPKLRMIVMSDPNDRIVSYASQAAFVTLAKLHNASILHLLTDASDKDHHGLAGAGIRAATDCAKGVNDQELIKLHQNTTARVARF